MQTVKVMRGRDGRDGKRGPAGLDGDVEALKPYVDAVIDARFGGQIRNLEQQYSQEVRKIHAGKNGKDGLSGKRGDRGQQGPKGDRGPMPDHQWNGTSLRFERPDGTWGIAVELAGPKGDSGDRGKDAIIGAGNIKLKALIGSNAAVIPVGAIIPFRFSEIPENYLSLDGSSYSYDQYPVLAALYGASPGESFAVDDFRGLPLWGIDDESAGDIVGADARDLSHSHPVGTLSAANGGAHDHGEVTGPSSATDGATVGLMDYASDTHTHTISADGDHTHAISGSTAIAISGQVDVKPRRALIHWIIRSK